jgi:hypothetical protein
MRIMKAILMVFVVPAILYLLSVFQEYANTHMTLNPFEQLFIDGLQFIFIGLVIIGLFLAAKSTIGRQ